MARWTGICHESCLKVKWSIIIVWQKKHILFITLGAKTVVHQAPIVQKVNNAFHWISLFTEDSAIVFFVILIHWIVIYPVDSAIQRLNNWSQSFWLLLWGSIFIQAYIVSPRKSLIQEYLSARTACNGCFGMEGVGWDGEGAYYATYPWRLRICNANDGRSIIV